VELFISEPIFVDLSRSHKRLQVPGGVLPWRNPGQKNHASVFALLQKTSVNFKINAAEGNEPAPILTYLPKNVVAVFWSFLLSAFLPGRSSLFLSSV
jgi:hypothetical protein